MTELIQYRNINRWKYELTLPYSCVLDFAPPAEIKTEFIDFLPDGTLRIHTCYAWDGASGPCPDHRCVMRGSLIHDALCQLMRLGLLDRVRFWVPAALALKKVCIEDGTSRFWAQVIYLAVKNWGRESGLQRAK